MMTKDYIIDDNNIKGSRDFTHHPNITEIYNDMMLHLSETSPTNAQDINREHEMKINESMSPSSNNIYKRRSSQASTLPTTASTSPSSSSSSSGASSASSSYNMTNSAAQDVSTFKKSSDGASQHQVKQAARKEVDTKPRVVYRRRSIDCCSSSALNSSFINGTFLNSSSAYSSSGVDSNNANGGEEDKDGKEETNKKVWQSRIDEILNRPYNNNPSPPPSSSSTVTTSSSKDDSKRKDTVSSSSVPFHEIIKQPCLLKALLLLLSVV